MTVRVAMFIEYFYPFVGGAERQLEQLANRLMEKGVTVKVFTLHQRGLKKKESIGGVPVLRKYAILRFIKLPFGEYIRNRLNVSAYRFEDTYTDIDQRYWEMEKVGRWYNLRACFIYLYRFYLLVIEVVKWLTINVLVFFTFLREKQGMDIVHCHLMTSPFTSVVCRMGKLFGKKVVIKLGDIYDLSVLEKYQLSTLYLRNFKKNVDIFICIAQDIKEMLLGMGIEPERIVSIPNSVDVDRFSITSREERQKYKEKLSLDQKCIVTFVGSLKRKKGLDILLHSWKDLAKDNPGLYLILVGRDDNHAKYIRDIVRDYNLMESVRFEGEVANVSQYLSASDIFVLPSRSEGMSNALLEAISTGLPVICTAVGGAKDIIQNGYNGILVEPGRSEPLKEAIELLIQDKDMADKLGRNVRKTAEEKYSLEKISDEYIGFYRKLL